jgi:hypothetical protein
MYTKNFKLFFISAILLPLSIFTNLNASDSAGITGTVTTLSDDIVQQKHINLKEGWNLIGINAELTLDQLKEELGSDNILVINGENSVYKKGSPIQSFEKLEKKKGYYIKLATAKGLDYKEESYENISISLVEGWNRINPPTELTLTQIKEQLGDSLLVINGGDGTLYKANSPVNTFTKFTEPYGYMIKVSQDNILEF